MNFNVKALIVAKKRKYSYKLINNKNYGINNTTCYLKTVFLLCRTELVSKNWFAEKIDFLSCNTKKGYPFYKFVHSGTYEKSETLVQPAATHIFFPSFSTQVAPSNNVYQCVFKTVWLIGRTT